MEIAGNRIAKEYFQRVGVPMAGEYYDYSNDKVTKYKNDLANKVEEVCGSGFEVVVEKVDDKNKVEFEKNEKMFKEMEEKKEEIKESSKFSNFTHETEKKNDFKVSKTNKIKKVDIDFDFDNFNPSVDNMKVENKSNDNQNSNYGYSSKVTEKPKDTSNEISSDFKKKLANKKAISSEDYAEENHSQDLQTKNKLNSMKGQTAISSDELFGNGPKEDNQKSLGSTLKDYALNFTLGAAEKAKQIKDKTKSLINTIQAKYQNN